MKSLQEYQALVSFLYPSLATAAAVSLSASPAGVLVVLRQESLLALALPQVVAAGVAIGLNRGWPPIYPAIGIVALAMGVVAWARSRQRAGELLPALYVSALSISVLLIVHSGAHLAELQNLFTGIDVAVAPEDAGMAGSVLLLTLLPTFVFWRRWLLLAQAPATAQIAGIHPERWHFLFLATLSTIVLVATDMLGIVLVLVMLFLPAAAALPWSRRLPFAMLLATGLGLVANAAGFVLSTEMEWPLSQSAGLAGAVIVVISLVLRAIWK